MPHIAGLAFNFVFAGPIMKTVVKKHAAVVALMWTPRLSRQSSPG
jgi:hypothetical protein